ncbi:VRR-NUC domain-containing protein [Candidatus Woesebacteria bacterium]|nr:VRR-NUC domain-containing protein [Candidatus Woesebacteria bacterium]
MTNRMSLAEYRDQQARSEGAMTDAEFKAAIQKADKKSKTAHEPTEHEIQKAILERLQLLSGGYFWRENSGAFQIAGKNGKTRFLRAGLPGIPDIMGVYQGHAVGIEVKRPKKKQSLDQKLFEAQFSQCGGIYLVCTDSADVVGQITAAIAAREGSDAKNTKTNN